MNAFHRHFLLCLMAITLVCTVMGEAFALERTTTPVSAGRSIAAELSSASCGEIVLEEALDEDDPADSDGPEGQSPLGGDLVEEELEEKALTDQCVLDVGGLSPMTRHNWGALLPGSVGQSYRLDRPPSHD